MAYSRAIKDGAGLAALALILFSVPFLTDDFRAYQLGTYLLYGVVAQGIALTWGRTGFLSLGQGLFFGLGAYASGLVLIRAHAAPAYYPLLLLAVAGPAALAYLLARLLFARQFSSGVNFSLITLALAMLGAQIANEWVGITGGFNGLSNIPDLPGFERYSSLYYLVVVLVLCSTGLLVVLYRTPLGALWHAISQNENRLQFFGFATDRLKALAFAISAGLAGLAGLLYAGQQGLVTPQAVGFQLSSELVIWTAVGGRFGPYGALLGAAGIGLISSELREIWADWEVPIALIFIGVVWRFPRGMAGAFTSAANALARRLRLTMTLPDFIGAMPAPKPDQRPASTTAGAVELVFRDVRVRLGDVSILDGLGLRISEPGIHCIIGPNGAGKTSSFNVLTGRLSLTGGDIYFNGQRVSGARADTMARLGVGRKFQIPSVFRDMSIRENLCIAIWSNCRGGLNLLRASMWHWRTPLWAELEQDLPFLRSDAERLAGELSQGQRQMLELAMTILSEPSLLLLDEPCAGLSPSETRQQTDVILKGVARLRNTALVIEHDMAAVESLSDHVHVLHQGKLLASGSLAEIRGNPAVRAVYAGGKK